VTRATARFCLQSFGSWIVGLFHMPALALCYFD
jgi:hypothetical protein